MAATKCQHIQWDGLIFAMSTLSATRAVPRKGPVSHVLYSHRLKTIIQHTVVDLGVQLTITDENASISLRENEAVLQEVAALMRVALTTGERDGVFVATFARR